MLTKRKRCRRCRGRTVHSKAQQEVGCGAHVGLCLLTLGLWLPVAMVVVAVQSFRNGAAQWVCDEC